MLSRVIAVIAAVGALASGAAAAVLMNRYLPGMSFATIVLEQDLLSRLLTMLACIVGVAVAIVGLSQRKNPETVSTALAALGLAGFLLGALAAAYGEMNTQTALSRVGPVSFGVTAPGRIEELSALTLGLAVLSLAFGLRLRTAKQSLR